MECAAEVDPWRHLVCLHSVLAVPIFMSAAFGHTYRSHTDYNLIIEKDKNKNLSKQMLKYSEVNEQKL